MDELRAMACGGLRDYLGTFALDGVETLLAALEQDADEIDRCAGVAHGGIDRGRIAHVRLHGVDLPDAPERLQMPGEIGPTHRHANPIPSLGQRPDHMAAEEAGAAEDRDQRFVWDGRHAALSASGSTMRCEYSKVLALYRGRPGPPRALASCQR